MFYRGFVLFVKRAILSSISRGLEVFVAEASEQGKHYWRDEYTAQAMAEYFREGFTPTGSHGTGAVDPNE